MIAGNPILTATQKEFLAAFSSSPLARNFALSGGTALAAFYLCHRLSEDLDFFTGDPVDGASVRAFLSSVGFIARYSEQHLYDRNIFLIQTKTGERLKAEFTRYPFPRFEEPTSKSGVMVEGRRDLAANKLAAFLDRRDPKDAVDLFFLAQVGPSFEDLVRDAELKFGIAGARYTLESRLMGAAAISDWPRLLKPVDPSRFAEFFRAEAKRLVERDVANE